MPDVDYLYETPDTGQLRIGPDGRAVRVSEALPQGRPLDATLGPVTNPAVSGTGATQQARRGPPRGLGGTKMSGVRGSAPKKRMTDQEMLAWADNLRSEMGAQHAASMARGPAVWPGSPTVQADPVTPPPAWLEEYMRSNGQ